MESGKGDSVKYFTWPLSLSGEALSVVTQLLDSGDYGATPSPSVAVELENMANEGRAMLQQIAAGYRRPAEPEDDIDPLLR